MFLGYLHFTQECNKNPPRFANVTRKLYSKQSSRNHQNTLAKGNRPQTGTQESQPLLGASYYEMQEKEEVVTKGHREGGSCFGC